MKLDQQSFLGQALSLHAEVSARIQSRIGRAYQALLSPDDVMQVTYIEALVALDDFIPEGPRALERWLERIATRNLHDAIRGLTRQIRSPEGRRVLSLTASDPYSSLWLKLVDSTTSPSQHVRRDEAKKALEQALGQLPPDYRKAVELYDLQERGIREVASLMQRSPGAVHMLRARALDHLRKILSQFSLSSDWDCEAALGNSHSG